MKKDNILKKDFPMFSNNPNIVYLDSAATTQKPQALIDAISDYYINYNSNLNRSINFLSNSISIEYDVCKEKIKNFCNAYNYEVVFTPSATFSINMLSDIFLNQFSKNKINNVYCSILEHHSNILPWQKYGKFCNLTFIKDFNVLYDRKKFKTIKENSILSLVEVSNITGHNLNYNNSLKSLFNYCESKNTITILDGTQGICSHRVNLDKLNVDIYVFSAHKIYGPMGLGVMLIKKSVFNSMTPQVLGGGIVEDVSESSYTLTKENNKFEAGTPNIEAIFSFSKTLDYLNDINFYKNKNCKILSNYLELELSKITGVTLLHKHKLFEPLKYRGCITSFEVKNIHPHDLSTYLSKDNVCIRVGTHCTMPLLAYLNINSVSRVSIGIYNDVDDIDKMLMSFKKAIEYFKSKQEREYG